MRCKDIKKLIVNFDSLDNQTKIKIEEHIKKCSECQQDQELNDKLVKIFNNAGANDNSEMIPMELMKQKVEKSLSKNKKDEYVPKFGFLKSNPLILGAATTALFLLAFMLNNIDFNPALPTGYEVTLNNVDAAIAGDGEDVCDMLFSAGIYEAAVDIIGCSNTCDLKIFDLKNKDEAERVVNLFNKISVNKINYQVIPVTEQSS